MCPHPVVRLILEWFEIASWIAFQKIPQEDTGANSFNLHVYLNKDVTKLLEYYSRHKRTCICVLDSFVAEHTQDRYKNWPGVGWSFMNAICRPNSAKSSTISRRLLNFVLLNHPITNMSGAGPTLQKDFKVVSGCFGLQGNTFLTSEHLTSSVPEGFELLQSSCSQQLNIIYMT